VRRTLALLFIALCASTLATAGCGSNAAQYAQEVRSSYISARAVLVGLEEFPSQMEEILRSGDISAHAEEARELLDYARDLQPTVISAFSTVEDNCELLKGESSDKYGPYSDKMLELVALNGQVVNAYTEFIGLSNSVLEGLPYGQDPEDLMPTLNSMDSIILRIQQLEAQIQQLEGEAEAIYQEITN
jgi:outer membrane murein-binding lipoprotein Lpp